jgi:hypothetical protein
VAATQRYLGARTAFGIIIHIDNQLYNATVTVEACDGSVREYRLPFLIAHGLTLPDEEHTCENAPPVSPSGSPSTPAHPSGDTPTSTCS